MWSLLIWWLTLEVIGLLALPIALRLFRFLPDRGLGFARQVGLLLGGYLFWVLTVLGLTQNTTANIVFVFLLLAALSGWLLVHHRADMLAALRERLSLLAVTEALFFLALAGWAVFRAHNPEIAYTEKPMEFGFVNAILRSRQFPPQDHWLSGFAISYYYFGYVLVAMLTCLSGLPSDITFNLAGVTLFALTVNGAFTVVYNMAQATLERRSQLTGTAVRLVSWTAAGAGLLGSLFVSLLGNLEGIFEVIRSQGLGSPALWVWLDVKNLQASPPSETWYPNDLWWWWRASRVIHDRDALGNSMEVISEFPFFSFLLGDNHPHVLALPFVFLALALALNLLLSIAKSPPSAAPHPDSERHREPRAEDLPSWQEERFASTAGDAPQSETAAMDSEAALRPDPERHPELQAKDLPLHQPGSLASAGGVVAQVLGSVGRLWPGAVWDVPLWALLLGSFGFLNTWDYPIYLGIFVLAYAIYRQFSYDSLGWEWLFDVIRMGLLLLVLGLVFYLPFYYGFRSQAGGIGLVGLNKTRLHQFLLMLGPFVVAVSALLVAWVVRWRRTASEARKLPRVAQLVAAVLALLAVRAATQGWWTAVLLLLLMAAAAILLLWGSRSRAIPAVEAEPGGSVLDMSSIFALLALLAGLALAFSVEFIFLRDTFGTRMNTVFKFYYQAWVLLAIVSAYGVFCLVTLLARAGRLGRAFIGLALGAVSVLTAAGLTYTVTATVSKANGFRGPGTLDGTRYVADNRPNDYAAVQWLRAHAREGAVMLEAPGGSYSEYNWVSAHTGIPTVLGWGGHELQWRGNYDEPSRREPDIATIYQGLDVSTTVALLDRYGIDYVYVSRLERDKYHLGAPMIAKFDKIMIRAFEQGDVVIFARAGGQ